MSQSSPKTRDIEEVHYLKLYKKDKVFCTKDEPEWTQNQVPDIFSLSKNP